MVEHTEYDDVVTCDHSYDKRCHTSYVTSFVSQQQQECEENFRKVRIQNTMTFVLFVPLIGAFRFVISSMSPMPTMRQLRSAGHLL